MNGFWTQFAFYVLAVIVLGAAFMVVSLRNIVHCALFLALAFIGVAGLFILLNADFLASVQVLIYVGAITVLILFAIMLTHKTLGAPLRQANKLSPLGVLGAVGLFLVTVLTTADTRFLTRTAMQPADSTTAIAGALLGKGNYVVPFEVASLLLLAAMIGAIVIAREKDE